MCETELKTNQEYFVGNTTNTIGEPTSGNRGAASASSGPDSANDGLNIFSSSMLFAQKLPYLVNYTQNCGCNRLQPQLKLLIFAA